MTIPADTLVCDSAAIATWQANPDYDYNRELVITDFDLWEWITRWVGRLLAKMLGSDFADQYTEPVLFGLGIVIIASVLWLLYKKRPELFMRVRKNSVPYLVHEDTIYGVDFVNNIQEALALGDYREAIRLLYLQTLKQLSDDSYIDWQLYKTPTEYVYEVKPESMRIHFRRLTNDFLRVRYGNFEATESVYQEMKTLQEAIRKGGVHEG